MGGDKERASLTWIARQLTFRPFALLLNPLKGRKLLDACPPAQACRMPRGGYVGLRQTNEEATTTAVTYDVRVVYPPFRGLLYN